MQLSDVRINIDRVDKEIRKLFIERMDLADQVACVKAETADEIFKPDREVAIIEKNSSGLDPKLVREYTSLIKRIMAVSRKYQYGRTLELRDCFPFEYSTEDVKIESLAMLKKELYLCDSFSKDKVVTVDSYQEISQLIREGKVQAGMGIIEEVSVGVSDEIHQLLGEDDLYIVKCDLIEENGVKKKLVTFSDKLIVLPDHNRIKIMFECPNIDGSLSGILSMISDYGVNLTEIHSRPFVQGDSWNYKFFVEVNANLDTKENRAMLFQLDSETENLKIMGSYYCGEEF